MVLTATAMLLLVSPPPGAALRRLAVERQRDGHRVASRRWWALPALGAGGSSPPGCSQAPARSAGC
ncbi:hypothetical protein [Tessaracoccus defluvii]|uniref:Uncharacterized protein n=1 Tax=Tessaracoccus defluvii TaxID=1285901 RepID=A0A7H0H5U0_9ACTN|nr:hypothetical protein [Tessaracoccus defluvii]QNP55906.1 hypothetical protein H9L22_17710 [Tessaracoccus defluvii]